MSTTGITLVITNNIITGATYSASVGDGTKTVTIPPSVTSIADWAFQGLGANLTSINIPSSVVSIGNSGFYGCWKLTSIIIFIHIYKL